jgi:aminoglycoside phosphotransferase (APT) family kinase protein
MEPVPPARDQAIEGIDHDGVSSWLASSIGDATPPFTFELIAGGRSNLTYRVTDAAGNAFALRRPPVSHVLPTAHDMKREYTVISALFDTGVPVPRTFGLCNDLSVNGAPFFVMSFVNGHILRNEEAALLLSEASRARAGHSLVDTLAQLHAVDVDAIGLGDFARRQGYIERQLKRWHSQFTQSTVDGVTGPVVIDRVHDLLAAHVPDQQAVSIVHGDYRLDNTVLDDDGTVRAILDWEICTLGDPLADLGLLCVYWAEPDDDDPTLIGVTPTAAPGFPRRSELISRYASASGLDVSQISYYQAFGYWKLACILQGVHARYAGGAAAGDRSGVDQFASHVGRLGERALTEVESL